MTRIEASLGTTAAMTALLAVAACGARTPLTLDNGAEGDLDAATSDAPLGPSADASPDRRAMCTPVTPNGEVCNALATPGPLVTVECAPGAPPVPTGGSVADGSYVMTASSFYGAPCVQDEERIVWDVCGASWATAEHLVMDGMATSKTLDGIVTFSGASVSFDPACGPPGVTTTVFGYDATPTTLTLYTYSYGPGTVRVDSFVQQ